MYLRLFLLLITLLAVPLSFVRAPYPNELVLQHVPTVIGVLILGGLSYFRAISTLSLTSCLAFLWIHIIGARWIYSFVPYDDWSRALAGISISEYFGWSRNHYDRLVHFTWGIFALPPAAELLQRCFGMRPAGAAFIAISLVLSAGALYEIFEWQLAMTLSPHQAEAYNGQQGDVWDPQQDLAIALFGSILCAPLLWSWQPNKHCTHMKHLQRSC